MTQKVEKVDDCTRTADLEAALAPYSFLDGRWLNIKEGQGRRLVAKRWPGWEKEAEAEGGKGLFLVEGREVV